MPLPYHLIDGYNLLHAADLARKNYGPGDLERARFSLLVRIADGLDESARTRTTVVFDAADPPPDADRQFRFREIDVLFSVATGDADAAIEELIRRHSSPRQLRVVSDDIRLQQAARRRGAQAVKSEAFLRRLGRRRRSETETDSRSSNSIDEVQVEGWLDYFGIDAGAVPTEPRTATAKELGREKPRFRAKPSQLDRNVTRETADRPEPTPVDVQPSDAVERSAPPRSDDLSFWQNRIEDVISEERQSTRRRPDAG